MNLRKYVGKVLMAVAALHTLVAFVLFGGWLLDILRGGVFNPTWTTEALASFWFLLFSPPVFLLGYTTQWAYARTGQIPAALGPWLTLVSAVCVLFLPASGLWLVMGVGIFTWVAVRRQETA